ncbi:MCIN protein, partial [Penelope pileata]|nr:MCIN protein [Penelope pileata]
PQDEPEFDFQELRDAVDDFMSEAPALVAPPLDCAGFDFCLGEEAAFGSCTTSPPRAAPCWRDAAERQRRTLGDALEESSQLQEALARRQEEVAALRESNAQLQALASQARELAAVLDNLIVPQCPDGAALPAPAPPPAGSCGGAEAAGVGGMLRAVSAQCRAALRSLAGSPAPKRPRTAPRSPGSDSLRAALGERGGIRTLSFPQGNAFVLRTAAGGYRFRWVPR